VLALGKAQPEILKKDIALRFDCENRNVPFCENSLPFCLLFLGNLPPCDVFLQDVQRIEIADYILAACANVFG
jgi:hypothetical protein